MSDNQEGGGRVISNGSTQKRNANAPWLRRKRKKKNEAAAGGVEAWLNLSKRRIPLSSTVNSTPLVKMHAHLCCSEKTIDIATPLFPNPAVSQSVELICICSFSAALESVGVGTYPPIMVSRTEQLWLRQLC